MDDQNISGVLLEVYRRLMDRYGPQHWWPAREPFEVIVGAVLTQSAAWSNVEKAIANLRAANKLSPASLRHLSEAELAGLIRPSGYYNVKARKLKAFAAWLGENYHDDLEKLFAGEIADRRRELLEIYGIGEETADSILLYAGRQPIFVIDAYTRRSLARMGIVPEKVSYAACQGLFMAGLPADTRLFNEYHALLVKLGKEACRTRPHCGDCCLNKKGAAYRETSSKYYPCAVI